MRVAIVHYWLVASRGGEMVVKALCEMFPDAVIFTHVSDPKIIAELFPGREVRHSFIAGLPFARRHYQKYLPLMPLALEELDLSEFDLVISSESGPAKGVIPNPGARHICYCHTPMRYLWDQRHLYRQSLPWAQRSLFSLLSHPLRQWDVSTAARVDDFVANSAFVAKRIKKYYRREADIIHPPVDIHAFADDAATPPPQRAVLDAVRDAYLWVGQLTQYKRPDLAVEAMSRLNRPLAVIGEGEEAARLKSIAGPTVKFLGRVDRASVIAAYQNCRALVFPGEEDFGIVPVEAMAAGKPVIAYAAGGALETIVDNETGVFFRDACIDSLIDAVERLENELSGFNSVAIKSHAGNFSTDVFKNKFFATLKIGENASASFSPLTETPLNSVA